MLNEQISARLLNIYQSQIRRLTDSLINDIRFFGEITNLVDDEKYDYDDILSKIYHQLEIIEGYVFAPDYVSVQPIIMYEELRDNYLNKIISDLPEQVEEDNPSTFETADIAYRASKIKEKFSLLKSTAYWAIVLLNQENIYRSK